MKVIRVYNDYFVAEPSPKGNSTFHPKVLDAHRMLFYSTQWHKSLPMYFPQPLETV
jgi:hypothetical protein